MIQRVAPQVGLHTEGVGVFFASLVRRQGGRLLGARGCLRLHRRQQSEAEAEGRKEFCFHSCSSSLAWRPHSMGPGEWVGYSERAMISFMISLVPA
ncbi:hypothetical protein D3C81_1890560 [compost metagenome]